MQSPSNLPMPDMSKAKLLEIQNESPSERVSRFKGLVVSTLEGCVDAQSATANTIDALTKLLDDEVSSAILAEQLRPATLPDGVNMQIVIKARLTPTVVGVTTCNGVVDRISKKDIRDAVDAAFQQLMAQQHKQSILLVDGTHPNLPNNEAA